jgi:5-methylthioadenosine/S-adenosylhomocysteine deaminase
MTTLNFASVVKPVAQLVFNGQPQNVMWVFVAGRALKEDGRLTGANERKVIESAQRAADHLTPLLKP